MGDSAAGYGARKRQAEQNNQKRVGAQQERAALASRIRRKSTK